MQMTGGSSSVWSGMEQFRQAGAAARAMLIAAAAQRWSIEPIYCRTESGAVFDNSDGKLLTASWLPMRRNYLRPQMSS